jgi:hypothetical protein
MVAKTLPIGTALTEMLMVKVNQTTFDKIEKEYTKLKITKSDLLRSMITQYFNNKNREILSPDEIYNNENITIKIPSELQEKYINFFNIETMQEIIFLRNRINPKTNKQYGFREIAKLIGIGLKNTNEFYNSFNKEIYIKK